MSLEVDDADLALAEIAEILRVLQLQAFDTGHRFLGGIGGKIAKAELASARSVDHLVIAGLHFGRRHAPALGGGGLQHRARRGADLAHRHQIMPRAARAVGILVAVFDLVAGRLLDPDARPVGFHLLGDDQRQAGPHAGSHLGAVADDGDDAVGRDRDEHAGIDHGAVRHLRCAGLVGGESRARHHGRGEHEAAGDAEAFQDAAAGNVLDLEVPLKATELFGIGEDIHDHTPVDARCTAFSMRW